MKWVILTMSIIIFVGCAGTNGSPAPPPDTGPKIGVMAGDYSYLQNDAARVTHLGVLDDQKNVLAVQTLDRDISGVFRFEGLPLKSLHLAFIQYDLAWGQTHEIVAEDNPYRLTLDRPSVSGIRYEENDYADADQFTAINYRLYPENYGPGDSQIWVCTGYRLSNDPLRRVRINLTSLDMLRFYSGDGPLDYNNSGGDVERIMVPRGANVIWGWYQIPELDLTDRTWTIGTLLPIVEVGPVSTPSEGTVDIHLDLSKRGNPLATR